jgi:hypothetical protein
MDLPVKISRNNIRLAIWLIGLGLIWFTNQWWPGILILLGISMLVDRLFKPNLPPGERADQIKPEPVENGTHELPDGDMSLQENLPEEPIPPEQDIKSIRNNILPSRCPHCGAPIKSTSEYVNGQYECAFCGTRLISH